MRGPIMLLLGLIVLPVTADDAVQENTPAALNETARRIIETFAGRLQSELQQALATGRPVNAIDVCKLRAPAIAAELSTDGWQVKRVSLKPRNPLNTPDEFERRTLLDFENKHVRGWNVERLAYYRIRQHQLNDRVYNEFRYMKAIPTRALCLSCHGENIAPDIMAKLDAEYPDDQARGYKLNDLRGAFSLRKRYETIPADAPQKTQHEVINQSSTVFANQ